ncbi:MAG: hypothetical protein ACK2UU_02125, partial [Anaerolineae bacterium]
MGEPEPVVPSSQAPAPWRSKLSSRGKSLRRALPILLILIVAAALRFWGLNWDEGQWLHPDER